MWRLGKPIFNFVSLILSVLHISFLPVKDTGLYLHCKGGDFRYVEECQVAAEANEESKPAEDATEEETNKSSDAGEQ